MNRVWIAPVVGAAALLSGGSVLAQEDVSAAMAFYSLDNIVLFFSAVLVLFMQAGFAALESEQDLSQDDRNFVLDITILFENAVHTLGRYGRLLRAT